MRWQPPLHISTCDLMSKMSEGRQISVFDMPLSIIEHLPVSSSSLPDRDSVRKRYFKWSLTMHWNHEWQKYGNETSASDNCLNGFRLLLRKGEHGHLCRASQEYFVTVPFLLVRIANIYIYDMPRLERSLIQAMVVRRCRVWSMWWVNIAKYISIPNQHFQGSIVILRPNNGRRARVCTTAFSCCSSSIMSPMKACAQCETFLFKMPYQTIHPYRLDRRVNEWTNEKETHIQL